ncbi:hypothetical protein O9992_24555 [Vibrio lentus]|nr:hypothetical protein [Vibrio lentus]
MVCEFKTTLVVATLKPQLRRFTRSQWLLPMVKSNKWGVNSFLESDRKMQPRVFKTQQALLNVRQKRSAFLITPLIFNICNHVSRDLITRLRNIPLSTRQK